MARQRNHEIFGTFRNNLSSILNAMDGGMDSYPVLIHRLSLVAASQNPLAPITSITIEQMTFNKAACVVNNHQRGFGILYDGLCVYLADGSGHRELYQLSTQERQEEWWGDWQSATKKHNKLLSDYRFDRDMLPPYPTMNSIYGLVPTQPLAEQGPRPLPFNEAVDMILAMPGP